MSRIPSSLNKANTTVNRNIDNSHYDTVGTGIINLQKASGGITKISSADGTGVTELVVPESGNLVSVDTAVTDNAIARYDGTTGKLQNSGVVVNDSGNVGIKNFTVKPWFSGHTVLNTGNYSSFYEGSGGEQNIANNSYSYGTNAYKYITSGLGASKYVNNFGISTWHNAPAGNEDGEITWTKLMELGASGDLLLTSGTGALGYGAGAGGTVTQLTSKAAAVRLSKPTGRIVTTSDYLAAGASVLIRVNNPLIGKNDSVAANLVYTSTYSVDYYSVRTAVHSAGGSFWIILKNETAAARAESVTISFAIIKGATA